MYFRQYKYPKVILKVTMFSESLKKRYQIQTAFFRNALLKNKLANSYIFISSSKNESFEFSLEIAKILNCKENTREKKGPWNICINCKWLNNNSHPQALITVQVEKESKKEQIKIDSIRELLNNLQVSSDYYRVIFFEESNLNILPAESCNLLLKKVEETPPKILFIFRSSTKNDILPTILSRSQIIYLNKQRESLFETTRNSSLKEDSSFPPENIKEGLDKAKIMIKHLADNNISMKDFLISQTISLYEKDKHQSGKEFLRLYKNLNESHMRHKAFIQNKTVIEDLFINSVK